MAVLRAWMSAHHMHIQCPGRPEGDSRSLRLELQMIMSYQVGAGNQTWFQDRNKCS